MKIEVGDLKVPESFVKKLVLDYFRDVLRYNVEKAHVTVDIVMKERNDKTGGLMECPSLTGFTIKNLHHTVG